MAEVNNTAVTESPENRRFESLSTFTAGQASATGVSAGNATINPVASNYYSALRTRSVVEPDYIYTDFPVIRSVPKDLSIDYSRILNKPFFIKNINWSAAQNSGYLLDQITIPFDIIVNELSKYPFHTSVLYRAKVSLIYQVAATPMHQGTMIVAALPMGTFTAMNFSSQSHFNKMMAAPHGFLYANESTAVRIQVPFYCNTKLINTDLDSNTLHPNLTAGNYAEVVAMVMNPLAQPTSASESVTISVHAVFDDLEFYIPHVDIEWTTEGLMELGTNAVNGVFGVGRTLANGLCDLGKTFAGDALDYLRGVVKKYTGLHNPNIPILSSKMITALRQQPNAVDIPTYFEKLDPYSDFSRITKDTLFDTIADEMDMKHILSKPYYVTTFRAKVDDPTGKLLLSRPITPAQQIGTDAIVLDPYGSATKVTPLDNLTQMFYHISKYWRGGMTLHIQSNMTNFHFCKLQVARNYSPVEEQFTGNPVFSTIQNLMVETLEFSGGGQVQSVALPFVSSLDYIPTTTDWQFNAACHGMYYIYLAQPIVTNGAVPTDIYFNVYLSCNEDFQYYGYGTNALGLMGINSDDFEAEAATMQPISDQAAVTNPGNTVSNYDDEFLRPIVSVRDYTRRMYRSYRRRYSPTDLTAVGGVLEFPLSDLIKKTMPVTPPAGGYTSTIVNPMQMVRRAFLGSQGGARVKAVVTGSTAIQMWYVPPGYSLDLSVTSLESKWCATNPIPTLDPSTVTLMRQSFDLEAPDSLVERSFSSVVPVIERPNYTVPVTGASSHRGDATNVLMGASELEAHIPNLSIYRFLGDPVNNYYTTDITSASAFDNMGTIIISTGNPALLNPGVGNTDTSIELSIFVGFDDEARLGYQVFAPTYYVPTAGNDQLTVCNQGFTRVPPSSTPNPFVYFTNT